MASIIYAERIVDLEGNNTTKERIRTSFQPVIRIIQALAEKGCKTGYMFIDPLLESFEAANQFYFDILECSDTSMLNLYRSGCGPIQALVDAKMLINNKIVDAVFIFGHEPLATIKQKEGKQVINEGMSIFGDVTIPEAYNRLTHELLNVLDITKEQFFTVAASLFENYQKSYQKSAKIYTDSKQVDRNRLLDSMRADLFTLTDCANPYVDFTGGVIIANNETADYLEIPSEKRVEIKGAKYNVVADGPNNIKAIVGEKENIFTHLKKAYLEACAQSEVDFVKEFKAGNALMEVYTCYPPIPLAFLIATKMINGIEQAENILQNHEITVTGGLNLARAPWNNPALNALIALYEKILKTEEEYGLVHGNGGLGGLQGVAILQKKIA